MYNREKVGLKDWIREIFFVSENVFDTPGIRETFFLSILTCFAILPYFYDAYDKSLNSSNID